MSLIARHLEAAGIPTVILGSALDVVEHCGVARLVFTDFPLGNPCGKPWDRTMQRDIVSTGLDVLANATRPRTTVLTLHRWHDDGWRVRYSEVRNEDLEALRRKGEERRAFRARLHGEAQTRRG